MGTKRKAPGKGAGKGGRKVKVLDTEETSDPAGEETRDKVCVCVHDGILRVYNNIDSNCIGLVTGLF